MYSVRAFARLTGLTSKALRHYERLGLLTPARTPTRYRQYSLDDWRRVERILALKSLRLPLELVKKAVTGEAVPVRAQREALEARRAEIDRAIEALKQIERAAQPSVALDQFVAEATWDRWEAIRQKQAAVVPLPPARASESRVTLFRELEAALADDPSSVHARNLATVYRSTTDPDTLRALKNRAKWPSGMRRYVASLFDATPEVWDRVVTFVETAR